MDTFLQLLSLHGRHVHLEPLAREHAAALGDAAADGELWNLWYTDVPAREHMATWIDAALRAQARGLALPFVVRDPDSDRIVGSTRYCNVDAANRRLEIGYTWYAASVQRSAVNTECKRLLLAHAFETLHCIAVEFRTHWHNTRSREAILRLGAKQDGVLRHHRILADGSLRDTVVFSILAAEWPAVKRNLDARLSRGATP